MSYKISNIRATSITKDLKESDHISQFIILIPSDPKRINTSYKTTIIKEITRTAKAAIILFDIEGKTWWCKKEEFNTIEFALKNTTKEIVIWYRLGSLSPLPNTSSSITNLSASKIDGYELNIRFS